ncbi:MAG: nucleotide exchange factor GrpE [Candidatus Poribacteria bacterium]|nr:nucleotide exchange factor GrpE [Candidatus Poribacteria bacterium]
MNKEEQTINESTEVAERDTTEGMPVEEWNADTEIGQETSTEPSDGDPPPEDDSQTATEPNETAVTEPPPAKSEPDPEYMNVLKSVDQHLSNLQELFTGQIARNQNQKQMFDSIYREMKEYKENTLLDTYQKPVIHNLIQFYDNYVKVESQLDGISETLQSFTPLFENTSDKKLNKLLLKETGGDIPQIWANLKKALSEFRNNMENVRIELEEVLYRMDVEPYEQQAEQPKKLDRKLHKTIETIPTDDPDQDESVAEVRKIGFYWREKVFRPEEVDIFRYTLPADESEGTPSEKTGDKNSIEEKGDKTDG